MCVCVLRTYHSTFGNLYMRAEIFCTFLCVLPQADCRRPGVMPRFLARLPSHFPQPAKPQGEGPLSHECAIASVTQARGSATPKPKARGGLKCGNGILLILPPSSSSKDLGSVCIHPSNPQDIPVRSISEGRGITFQRSDSLSTTAQAGRTGVTLFFPVWLAAAE